MLSLRVRSANGYDPLDRISEVWYNNGMNGAKRPTTQFVSLRHTDRYKTNHESKKRAVGTT